MGQWIVELVTQENVGHTIELEATAVEKLDFSTVIVDGIVWALPPIPGMSFSRVECVLA